MTTCESCGGEYQEAQRDGAFYIHACPPLSEPEAAAISRGITVAALRASLNGAAVTLSSAEKEQAGRERTPAAVAILTAPDAPDPDPDPQIQE